MMRNSLVYWVSCAACEREIGSEGGSRRDRRAWRRARVARVGVDDRHQRGEDALPVGLPDRHRAGCAAETRLETKAEQVCVQRGVERHAHGRAAASAHARPDRRSLPAQGVASVAHGQAPGIASEEGAALRRRLETPLARWRERQRKFGDVVKLARRRWPRGAISAASRSASLRRRRASTSIGEPTPQRRRIVRRRPPRPPIRAHANRRRRRPGRTATARRSSRQQRGGRHGVRSAAPGRR